MDAQGSDDFPPVSPVRDADGPVFSTRDPEGQSPDLLHAGSQYGLGNFDHDEQQQQQLTDLFSDSEFRDAFQQHSPELLFSSDPGLGDIGGFLSGHVFASSRHADTPFPGLDNHGYPHHHLDDLELLLPAQHSSEPNPVPDPVSPSPAPLMGGHSPSTASLTCNNLTSPNTTIISSPDLYNAALYDGPSITENPMLMIRDSLPATWCPTMHFSNGIYNPATPVTATDMACAEVSPQLLAVSQFGAVAGESGVPVSLPEIDLAPSPLTQNHPSQPGPSSNKTPCPSCHKLITNKKRDQRRHAMTHMNDDKKVACPICHVHFGRYDNMKRHMKAKHKEDLPALARGPPKGSKRAPRTAGRRTPARAGNEGG